VALPRMDFAVQGSLVRLGPVVELAVVELAVVELAVVEVDSPFE
jgi:hypothetical protein